MKTNCRQDIVMICCIDQGAVETALRGLSHVLVVVH